MINGHKLYLQLIHTQASWLLNVGKVIRADIYQMRYLHDGILICQNLLIQGVFNVTKTEVLKIY